MKFLPFENITYQTKLNSKEVLQRLAEVTEPRKMLRFGFSSDKTKSYQGKIEGNSFDISRIIYYKNSFLPVIKGRVEQGFSGTSIHIKMRLNYFVLFFMIFWLGGICIPFISLLSQSSASGEFNPAVFLLLFMMLIGAGVTIGGFKYESKKAREDLEKLFEVRNAKKIDSES